MSSASAKAALASGDEARIGAAEKAVEIGETYAVYEELLREKDTIDFGDIILLATRLIQTNADVNPQGEVALYWNDLAEVRRPFCRCENVPSKINPLRRRFDREP